MVYRALRFFTRISLWAYFRRIQVSGRENIPQSGPCIFVGNHPSAFMDPLVMAVYIPQSVHFLTAGEYMGKGIFRKFLMRFFHMIPVYRPTTQPGQSHKNAHMFSACFEHLSQKRSLLLFPEGVSITERKLKPLKTGVARIARGAQLRSPEAGDVMIVPIGLNYSSPHQFRSSLYVNVGKPIRVRDFIGSQNGDEHKEIGLITEAVTNGLLEVILHLDDGKKESLLTQLEMLYLDQIKAEQNINRKDQAREFNVQKEIIAAIHYFERTDLIRLAELRERLDDFFSLVKEKKLNFQFRRKRRSVTKILFSVKMIFGLPLFVAGLILNFIPYRLTWNLNTIFTRDISFRGSMTIATGLVLFLLWYAGLTIAGYHLYLGWWALSIPLIAYVLGLITLLYKTGIEFLNEGGNLKSAIMTDKEFAEKFVSKRDDLFSRIEAMKQEFVGRKQT